MNLKDLNFEQKQQYYKTLCEMISPSRTELFEKVIEQRTDHLSIVLENIYQPQNASAVLRTAECLGVQQIFVIENNNDYGLNPDVALGANNWFDLHRFNRN